MVTAWFRACLEVALTEFGLLMRGGISLMGIGRARNRAHLMRQYKGRIKAFLRHHLQVESVEQLESRVDLGNQQVTNARRAFQEHCLRVAWLEHLIHRAGTEDHVEVQRRLRVRLERLSLRGGALYAELEQATNNILETRADYLYTLWWQHLERREDARRVSAPRSAQASLRVLNLWSAILPYRVATEDLGDYIEEIKKRFQSGQSPLIIYVRTAAAIFWTAVNALGVIMRAILGKGGGRTRP